MSRITESRLVDILEKWKWGELDHRILTRQFHAIGIDYTQDIVAILQQWQNDEIDLLEAVSEFRQMFDINHPVECWKVIN